MAFFKKLMLRFCFAVCLIFAGLYPASAFADVSSCPTASLQTYLGLDATGGCTVGEFTFFRFTDPSPTTVGSPTVATASEIMVTPIQTASGAGFQFTASTGNTNLFSVTSSSGTTSVTYFIDYSVDPAPVIGGADLSIDPPMGNASVTQYYCASDVLVNNCALGTESQQTVTTSSEVSSIILPNPSSFVDIATDISLVATPGNPASIDAIDALVNTAATAVPEPALFPLTGCLLGLLFVGRRAVMRRARG